MRRFEIRGDGRTLHQEQNDCRSVTAAPLPWTCQYSKVSSSFRPSLKATALGPLHLSTVRRSACLPHLPASGREFRPRSDRCRSFEPAPVWLPCARPVQIQSTTTSSPHAKAGSRVFLYSERRSPALRDRSMHRRTSSPTRLQASAPLRESRRDCPALCEPECD